MASPESTGSARFCTRLPLASSPDFNTGVPAWPFSWLMAFVIFCHAWFNRCSPDSSKSDLLNVICGKGCDRGTFHLPHGLGVAYRLNSGFCVVLDKIVLVIRQPFNVRWVYVMSVEVFFVAIIAQPEFTDLPERPFVTFQPLPQNPLRISAIVGIPALFRITAGIIKFFHIHCVTSSDLV